MISSKPRLVIPYGLKTLLEGMSRAVLKVNPANITQFAALYFKELIAFREGNGCLDIKELIRLFHQLKVEKWSEGATQEKKTECVRETEQSPLICQEPTRVEKSTDTAEDNISATSLNNKTTQFPSLHCPPQDEETTEAMCGPSKPATPKSASPPSAPSPELAYVPADPAQFAAQMLGKTSSINSYASDVLMVDVATSISSGFKDSQDERVSVKFSTEVTDQGVSQVSVEIDLGCESKDDEDEPFSYPLQDEQEPPKSPSQAKKPVHITHIYNNTPVVGGVTLGEQIPECSVESEQSPPEKIHEPVLVRASLDAGQAVSEKSVRLEVDVTEISRTTSEQEDAAEAADSGGSVESSSASFPSAPEDLTEADGPAEPEGLTEVESPTEAESLTEAGRATEAESHSEVENPTEPEDLTEAGRPTEPEGLSKAGSPTEAESLTGVESPTEPEGLSKAGSLTEAESHSEVESPTEPEDLTEAEGPAEPEEFTEAEGPAESEEFSEAEGPTEPEGLAEAGRPAQPGDQAPGKGLVKPALAASEAGPPPCSNMWTLYCLTDMNQQSRPSPPPVPGPFPQATLYLSNPKEPHFLQQPPKVTSPAYVMMDDKKASAPPFILVGSNAQEAPGWSSLPGQPAVSQSEALKRYAAVPVPIAVPADRKLQKHAPNPQGGSPPTGRQEGPRPQSPVFLSVAFPIDDVAKKVSQKGAGSGEKPPPLGSYGIAGEITVTTAHVRRTES